MSRLPEGTFRDPATGEIMLACPVVPRPKYLRARRAQLPSDPTDAEYGNACQLATADTVLRIMADLDPEKHGNLLANIGT